MGSGLWEVRASLAKGRVARVLFCAHEDQMILLHRFMKRTQKTSKHDLDLARDRKRQIARGGA
jgi:phage-related protein